MAKRQARLDKITSLGVNLEATPWEAKPEDTVLSRLDAIPYDANGDLMFDMQYDNLVLLSEKAKAAATPKQVTAPAAEAASAPKKKVPLLIGAGATETANTGVPAKSASGKPQGRHAVSQR